MRQKAEVVPEGKPVQIEVVQPAAETVAEIAEMPTPAEEMARHAETEAYIYIVKHGDWLSTIARDQLGNVDDWPKIRTWNSARLESAHLIYPYDELVLHKLTGSGKHYKYVFADHVVKPGDTLWDIAGQLYGDPFAWVVLQRDNMKYLPYGPRDLVIGQRLIVRSRISNQ